MKNMFSTPISFNHLNSLESFLICFLMGFLYVFSLYVWSPENRYSRNSTSVIKRRFLSVITTCLLCVIILNVYCKHDANGHYLSHWVGMRFDQTLFSAVLYPLCLTAVLFTGPLVQALVFDDVAMVHVNTVYRLKSWLTSYSSLKTDYLLNLFWWRNYVISPFTEEFVFRACMLPLLVHNYGTAYSIMITPLFFGLAHLHHIIEGIIEGKNSLKHIILVHLFQFFYTYLFGLYSSYVYLRTTNVFACSICHSFCNYMGFPSINEIFHIRSKITRYFIGLCYFLGVFAFYMAIDRLTDPILFGNNFF